MSNKGQLLQDPFLNTLRREHVPVSIYLVNGIKLQGQIESFDQYVVLLRNTVTQMVYKHAISTIVPGRAVNFSAAEGRRSRRRLNRPRASAPAAAGASCILLDCRFDRIARPPGRRHHPGGGGPGPAPFRRRARGAGPARPDRGPGAGRPRRLQAQGAGRRAVRRQAARPTRSRRWPRRPAPARSCSTSR